MSLPGKIPRGPTTVSGLEDVDMEPATLPDLGPIPNAARALGIEPHNFRIWIRTFGRLRVYLDYEEIPPGSWPYPKVQSLLRFLLLREGFVPLDEVLEAIWPQASVERARQNFSVALHHLRRTLEPHRKKHHDSRLLIYHDQQLRLNHSMILTDRTLFLRLARAAEAAGPENERYTSLLGKLVTLYAGPLYEDEPYQEWCIRERERLEQVYLMARQELAGHALERGNYLACIRHCEEGLDRDPLAEPFHLLLMQAYSAMGHRARVVDHYHRLRRMLDEELGVEPSLQIKKLYEQLLQG